MANPISKKIPLKVLKRRLILRTTLFILTMLALGALTVGMLGDRLSNVGPTVLMFCGAILLIHLSIWESTRRQHALDSIKDLDQLLILLYRPSHGSRDKRWISPDDGQVKIPADSYLKWRDSYYEKNGDILEILDYARAHQGELPGLEMLLPAGRASEEELDALRTQVLAIAS